MRLTIFAAAALVPWFAAAGQYGAPPPLDVEPVNIYAVYRLPAFRNLPTDPAGKSLAELQLGVRARTLGLTAVSPIEAWAATTSLNVLSAGPEKTTGEDVAFGGDKASDLNRILARMSVHAVRVTSRSINLDEPVMIARSGIVLDLGAANLNATSHGPYLVRIENANHVDLRGGLFATGDTAVLVSNSDDVRVSGLTIRDLAGAGIVATRSRRVVIRGNRISGLKYAGVILHRGVTSSLVEENDIENNLGTPNLAAAIVLTDREVDIAVNPRAIFGPEGYGVIEQALDDRRNPPSGNLIRANQLLHNQAGGVYSDGGVKNVIASNLIVGNAKEGICLDDGSIANVVTANVIRRNGGRWGESDAVLAMETIAAGGRLADGTPGAKVPGISLDNALYNVVFNNNVSQNYGGGIKFVRTGFFNIIGLNTLVENALGNSAQFHFFGIELGAAPGDATTHELDIAPARGNIVFSNMIRGGHYAGIFFGEGSDQNEVFDNVIMDATQWGLESVRPMPNTVLNNVTNIASRNIGSGIDPTLLVIGKPVMDALLPNR